MTPYILLGSSAWSVHFLSCLKEKIMKNLNVFLKEYFNYVLKTGYLTNRIERWSQLLWIPMLLSLFLVSSQQVATQRLGFILLLATTIGFILIDLVVKGILYKNTYELWRRLLKKPRSL